jgi:hypothetical protein
VSDTVIIQPAPVQVVTVTPASGPSLTITTTPAALVTIATAGVQGPPGNIAVGTSPPPDPQIGDLWVDTN